MREYYVSIYVYIAQDRLCYVPTVKLMKDNAQRRKLGVIAVNTKAGPNPLGDKNTCGWIDSL